MGGDLMGFLGVVKFAVMEVFDVFDVLAQCFCLEIRCSLIARQSRM